MRAKPTVDRKPASARRAAKATTATADIQTISIVSRLPSHWPSALWPFFESPSTWSTTKASGQGSASRIRVLSSSAVSEPASSGPCPFMKGRKRFRTRRMGLPVGRVSFWGTGKRAPLAAGLNVGNPGTVDQITGLSGMAAASAMARMRAVTASQLCSATMRWRPRRPMDRRSAGS